MEKEVKSMKEVKEDKKLPIESLVSDLIQQLMNFGADEESIIWTLKQYGFTEKEIKQEFGLPLDAEMGESKKPVMEKMDVEVYSYVDNQKLGTLDQVIVLRDLLDVMWNAVYLSGEGIDGRAVLFRDLDGGYELDLDKHEFGQDILKMKVKTDDSYDEDDDGYPIIWAKLTDEPLTEGRKPKITKKPLKEGIRLVYNPREKKTVKEEVKLSFDGEPLPVDIKESNTHTKLRLLKHK